MIGDRVEEKPVMIAMRLGGATLQEIGDRFGVTREWVRMVTKGAVPPRARPKDEKRAEKIRDLFVGGASVEDISAQIGLGCYRTRQILQSLGFNLEKPDTDRFWSFVEVVPGGCWRWKGAKTPMGYGRIAWNGKGYAHRVSWEIHNGPIPTGLVIMHKCDNPECTNPEHLALGTQADNIRDRDMKGRWRKPKHTTKISSEEVAMMRAMYRRGLATSRELSRIYGITPNYTSGIVNGKARKEVQ